MTRVEAPDTHFAPAARVPREAVLTQVRDVTRAPLMNALLEGLHGLLAVLNQQRQVLAVNQALLDSLGITDAGALLGMRPGEVLHCKHSGEMPGGCGTSRYCRSCGAAVAIVTSLTGAGTAERKCVIDTRDDRQLSLLVRASTFESGGERLVLLWLQDITAGERWSMVEQAFFHDVRNLSGALRNIAELLQDPSLNVPEQRELERAVESLAARLNREIEIQQRLALAETHTLEPLRRTLDLDAVVQELSEFARAHPLARGLELEVDHRVPGLELQSDVAALVRVVSNMLVNAYEASEPGDTVKLIIARAGERLRLSVWNRASIPLDVASRIFVLHFSTKPGSYRGLGTYAIKTLTKELLGGAVGFDSTPETGTTFWVELPLT